MLRIPAGASVRIPYTGGTGRRARGRQFTIYYSASVTLAWIDHDATSISWGGSAGAGYLAGQVWPDDCDLLISSTPGADVVIAPEHLGMEDA